MTESTPYTYRYPRPALTVDAVILSLDGSTPRVLLIQRGQDPFAGQWAFPGGFVNENEEPAAASARELVEETGLAAPTVLHHLGGFGAPGRDPRGWTVSLAYLGLVPWSQAAVRGSDDARQAKWRSLQRPGALAFDHAQILATARAFLRREAARSPLLAPLLPAPFKLAELHRLVGLFLPDPPALPKLRRQLEEGGAVRKVGRADYAWGGTISIGG